MSLNDPLANALSKILNAEKVGKEECIITPSSKIILTVLNIMKKRGYVGNFNSLDNHRGGVIKIKLLGHINKCGVIKPRMSVTLKTIERYEKRFLPAKDFGILIISTPKGIMTHERAAEKKLGGKLIAYIY